MKVILGGAADCTKEIEAVKNHLNENVTEVILCQGEDFIMQASLLIRANEAKKAVFFSQTGLDVWARAGKTSGICTAVCHSPIKAEEIRKEKEINAICVGTKINKLKYILSIVDIWLITDN